jgi:hypothetical protein
VTVIPRAFRGLVAFGLSMIVALTALIAASPAAAASPSPAWSITSFAVPSHFTAGHQAFYNITVVNAGGLATSGAPITINDVLPPGVELEPKGYGSIALEVGMQGDMYSPEKCVPGPPVSCTINAASVRPGEALYMTIPVTVEPGAGEMLTSVVSVSGGGAPGASAKESTPVSAEPSPFLFQGQTSRVNSFSGAADRQAGDHPYRLELAFQVNTNTNTSTGDSEPAQALRTVRTVLPNGLVINPNATPELCTEAELTDSVCPSGSAVGLVRAHIGVQSPDAATGNSPLFNMVPPHGVPAELGFEVANLDFPVHLLGELDPEGNYALTSKASELLGYGNVSGAVVELWGNPSDPSHDGSRGECTNVNFDLKLQEPIDCTTNRVNIPFITLPSACSGPLSTDFEIESWQGETTAKEVDTTDGSGGAVGVEGCGALEFHPTLRAQAEAKDADSPTGLQVGLQLPQNGPFTAVDGNVPPNNTVQQVDLGGALEAANRFTLSFKGDPTEEIPSTATAATIQAQLEALATIGAGNVVVTEFEPYTYPQFVVEFTGTLARRPEEPLRATENGGATVEISTLVEGHAAEERPSQIGTEAPLATATLKNLSITLPSGLAVDPSAAEGQGACSEEQIGYQGETDGRPVFNGAAPSCPKNSKLGTVTLTTPLVNHPLPGFIYLAKQTENPFGSLIALYVVVEDPISGILIKLPGQVQLDPVTGQVTATFKENPQLPFEELKTEFSGGPRAALTTPSTCGSYTTTSDLTPWSTPRGADAYPSDSFAVDSGADGAPCASSEGQLPNSPGFEAGTLAPLSGEFSPFVLKLSREDGSQRFEALNFTLPLGLVGKLAGVQQCSQTQIEAAEDRSHEGEGRVEQEHPSCPAGSELGTVRVGAGSGSPLYVAGHAYLAGPYKGAPFSVVVVTPAVAGPFDLGTVVVRAALYINPETAQATIKSDPLPTILDGIPLDIRSLEVNVSRSQFMFNPTSCEAMSITGELLSTAGSVAKLSNRFQTGGCEGLAFKPAFTVATSGKASKANGASLDVKLIPPAQGPQHAGHEEANVKYVKVELPKQLPSRLTTLQKACTAAQFAANPAGCPAASVVGHAVVHTPVLSVPLEGPAYFVSHGDEQFPQLVVVLQGEGVTVDLAGATFISKAGITSSTFKTVPDVPVSSFELDLPQGPYSALTTNLPHESHDLCGQKLTMPTEFIGQNGAALRESTPIAVGGCAPAITVVSHKVKGKTATVQVRVPAAGKLVATAKGLSKASKRATGATTMTVKLTLTQGEAAVLSEHKGRKLKATIRLTFTPKKGKKLKTSTTVIVG